MHSRGHSHMKDGNGGHMHGRHSHAEAPVWLIVLGIVFTLTTFALGMLFWRLSGGSIAILSDALHSLFHAALWSIALWANISSHVRKDARAGLVMGFIILAIGLYIGTNGIMSIVSPTEVVSGHMIIIAAIALASEIIQGGLMLFVQYKNVPIRRIFRIKIILRDNLIDMLASLGVLVGGAVILTTSFYRADGIAAILIALVAFYLARETIMESLEEFKPA